MSTTTTFSPNRTFAFFGRRFLYDGFYYWLPVFIESEEAKAPIIFAVYSVEMLMIFLAISMNIYFVYYIIKVCSLHTNLRFILGCYAFYSIFGVGSRVWLFILQLGFIESNELMMMTFICACIRVEFFALSTFLLPVIVFERAFATYYVMNYETEKRRWVALISLFIGIILTFSFSLPSLFTMTSSIYYVVLNIFVISSASLTFYVITKYNEEKLQKLKLCENSSNNEKYTLSARFQCDENLRVFKVLRYLFVTICCTMGCIVFCYIMAKFVFEKGSTMSNLFISFFDFFIAFSLILLPVVCIGHAGHLPFAIRVSDTPRQTSWFP
ncbi:unnamed protein product [Caenorhabditis angaria]|uniref:Uncharacterized protein n=1 Tax=Caenorhabditis angaria TaxID=860376 RepID=A0A9P1MVV0_9PELO|nr:unnamed protein product [Caenorhabditis angaria]